MGINLGSTTILNVLTFLSIFATIVTTFVLHHLSNINNKKTFLDNQLIELQRLSFYDTFVEDENYTHKWVETKEKYLNKQLSEEEIKKFLKYDVYTEMLFNFIEKALIIYKTEEKLLNYIDFKSWVRTHAECWKNPLKEHSNREVYGDNMSDMIDKWLK